MEEKEARRREQRRFFIHVAIMFLVSIAVFVVLTFTFNIPQLLKFQSQVITLTDRVTVLQNRVVELTDALAGPETDQADEPGMAAEEPTADAIPAAPPSEAASGQDSSGKRW